MPTRLSRYCEGIMEAAWLAAVVVVPVFFNVYSSRIFEPDKLTLLRSLALLILGAWVVKLIEQGRSKESGEGGKARLRSFLRTPLLPQVLLLALVYLIANIFSVTPRVSFWGSYQRLQGTYTTLSYIVVFAAIVSNLRRPQQIERLLTTIVLVSLPVGLYGILQRFQIDPVPWGGNVTRRIASNMGNSIFVAAYLIMAFPITVGRIVQSFSSILNEEEHLTPHIARGTVYVFIASIQLIAIYLSGSRGPMLGLLTGTFFFFVVLSLYWQKRWMTVGVVALAGVAGAFLVLLNIPNGPLESIRSAPWVGRFGQLLDTDQRTSQVRINIWKGAAKLVFPHDPLEYPDGKQDAFNFIRPLIGYGPESMYVAYNPFYPPKLGTLESRNASPDRSHNETWDSLVITGFIGLTAYLILFTSVFYYGLKWLGLITSRRQRTLFLMLLLGGGTLSAVLFIRLLGLEFFGVGLPFGMILGLIGYLPLVALFARYTPPESPEARRRAMLLMILLAAIVAHFVEIHFGIAIAATRTYFWVYTGLLLLAGYILPQHGLFGGPPSQGEPSPMRNTPPSQEHNADRKKTRRKKRPSRRTRSTPTDEWKQELFVGGLIITFILFTLGFDFISNLRHSTSTLEVIWTSFTRLPNKNNAPSYGILALLLTTWLAGVTLFVSETAHQHQTDLSWKHALSLVAAISGAATLLFYLFHANWLVNLSRFPSGVQPDIITQAKRLESVLTRYYLYLLLLILILARFLPSEWPQRVTKGLGMALAPFILILTLALVNLTNLRVIHADIAFKMAEPLSRGEEAQWQAAIELYRHAIDLAPSEDHYYLFLGRAYLELARTVQDPQERQKWMERADEDLKRAQKINPLNTDHTANLARLYRVWASFDNKNRKERAQTSDQYYARALVLSPQNSTIWSERAVLNLNLLKNTEKALEILNHALEVDPYFDGTHAILADYYAQTARQSKDKDKRQEALDQAILHYRQAISLTKKGKAFSGTRYNYLAALGGVYAEKGDYEQAITSYQQALRLARKKQKWQVEDTIARLYIQMGDMGNARVYANLALEHAPDAQKPRVQQIIDFLNNQSP